MAVQIQLRHDTSTNWTAANPLLMIGEMGLETDTQKQKIGDGVTLWNSLPYSYAPGVVSVGMTAPSLMTVSGSPITGTGTLGLSWSGAGSNLVNADGSTTVLSTLATVSSLSSYLTTATAASTYAPVAGDTSLVTVGTITTGTWHGSVVGTSYGGTGLSSLGTLGTAILPYTSASSGFLKWSGSAFSIDTSTYLTANQSITLSGDVSGTGTTAISVAVNKMLGNTIPANAAGFLQNNGTGTLSWGTAGVGTVTSIGLTVPANLSVTPASITSSGTFAVTWSGSAANFINADGSTTAHSLYATIASPTFTGTVTTPALTLSGFTTGTLINTSGVISALSGTNLVLGNGNTILQTTFNPATTTGDMIYSSSGTTLSRLAVGASGTILVGGTTPSWSSSPSISGRASIGSVAWGWFNVSSSPCTLTASSPYVIYNNVAGAIIKMPDETTIPLGAQYQVGNNTSSQIEIQDSAGGHLFYLGVYQVSMVNSSSTSSATGNWNWAVWGQISVPDGIYPAINNSLTFTGQNSSTIAFQLHSYTVAGINIAQTFTGTQTFSSVPTLSSLTTAGVLLNSASGVVSSSAGSATNFINADGSTTAHALYATIASPTFTGTVTTPAFTLSGFTTGILKNTSGVVGTATAGTDYFGVPAGTTSQILSGTGSVLSTLPTSALPTFTGDVAFASLATTVNGLKGNTIPTLATGYLNWTGSAWAFSAGGGMTNPMTTTGDMIYSSSGSTPARLAAVATGSVLASAGTGTAPTWNTNPVLTCIGETVQTVAVSTTPAVNCANGNNVIIGTTGVVGALTAATTITFSNVVVGTTTKVRIKQGTTSFAITLTISGYTFYGNGQTAGLASGGTPAQLAAGNMTLSQFYTIEILWATATVAYVSLLKT